MGRRGVVAGVVFGAVLFPGLAQAEEPAPTSESTTPRPRPRPKQDPWGAHSGVPYVRFEGDAVATPGVWPNPSLGGDVAIIAGRANLHARVGISAMGTPRFTLGDRGKVGTVLETSDIRGCAASHYGLHRVRLCAGLQAGVMHLRWSGFEAPGRRDLPWVAAVGDGGYAIALGRIVDLHAAIGLGVPLARPRLVTRTHRAIDVEPAGLVFSTFRVGLGFRLG